MFYVYDISCHRYAIDIDNDMDSIFHAYDISCHRYAIDIDDDLDVIDATV